MARRPQPKPTARPRGAIASALATAALLSSASSVPIAVSAFRPPSVSSSSPSRPARAVSRSAVGVSRGRRRPTALSAGGGGGGNDDGVRPSGKGTFRISGPDPSTEGAATATSTVDYVLSLLSSDVGSIVLGLLGLVACLYNRLVHIDYYDALTYAEGGAAALGVQSRADILAVFAAGAVLLNGVSKLDVTSALAETVALEGIVLDGVEFVEGASTIVGAGGREDVAWALESALRATPARTAALMVRGDADDAWSIAAIAGAAPADATLRSGIPAGVRSTPILDRFLKAENRKESYLPTLQALPGRVEFTYLPANAQEALLLPLPIGGDGSGKGRAVLVLGSDTAKSCTPRDIAWCQVLAARMGAFLNGD